MIDTQRRRIKVEVLNNEDINGHMSPGIPWWLPTASLFKNVVQQGRSHCCARSVLALREHGTRARTLLAAFFNRLRVELFLCCVAGLLTSPAFPAELPEEPVLPLTLATKAAQAAVDHCLADGYRVSVTVVDRGGNIRVLLRQDGAGPHTPDSSRKKAYTAASMKEPTAKFAELAAKMPVVQGLQHMNEHILLLGGGLPIKMGEDLVGGIGVGGAPGGHLDAACGQAGLASIGAVPQVDAQK